MTTRLREIAGSPRFILYATAILAILTFLAGRHYGLTRADWPGWLQAVGSVWAILVAVWVPWQQAEAHERREKQKESDELGSLLRLIRTEISLIFERVTDIFGTDLDNPSAAEPYLRHLPVPNDPFKIYNALLPNLGIIRDDATRDQIVRTYRYATGLFLSIHLNNRLIDDWHHSEISADKVAAEKRHNDLVTHYRPLQESYRLTKKEVEKLLRLLA